MSDDGLRRELGRTDATAVVIGAIIGVGIFFTPSRVAALAGDLALLTWFLGGLIATLGALTFAELGGMYPRTGGQYVIIRDAYGPGTGFVYVLCNSTAIQAGAIAIIAIVCVQNAAVALGGMDLTAMAQTIGAATLIVFIAAVNVRGVRAGALIQNVTVAAKILALVAVALVGLAWGGDAGVVAQAPPGRLGPLAAVFAGLVPALFSFGGWQQALWMGGEVKDPSRNLPFAIVVGVAVVITTYLAANWAYLSLLGTAGVAGSQALAADAVSVAFPEIGRRLVAGAVAVSALGVLNAQLLTGPRLVFALARDGRFFEVFGRVHATRGTPVPAIVLMTVTALVLLVAAGEKGLDRLLTGVVLVDTVFFALTGLASLVLVRRFPRADRPIRMPGFPVVPAVFVLAEVGVIVGSWMDPSVRGAALIGVAWMLGATALYFAKFRRGLARE